MLSFLFLHVGVTGASFVSKVHAGLRFLSTHDKEGEDVKEVSRLVGHLQFFEPENGLSG